MMNNTIESALRTINHAHIDADCRAQVLAMIRAGRFNGPGQPMFSLLEASALGDAGLVHALLDAGARPHTGALHTAAQNGHAGAIAAVFASRNAIIDNEATREAAHLAALAGDMRGLEILVGGIEADRAWLSSSNSNSGDE